MSSRWAGVGVLLCAGAAACAFVPVFGVTAVLAAVLAVLVPVALADAAALRWPGLAPWRLPAAVLVAVVTGVTVLCLPAAPWGAPLLGVLDGALHGWRHTLESTFPARPDGDLLAFVPLLALVAGVLGVEWLRRGVAPAATLVPGLLVLGLAQIFRAPEIGLGLALGGLWALGAAVVLAVSRHRVASHRPADVVTLVVPVVLVAALVATAVVTVDPWPGEAVSVHDRYEVAGVPAGTVSPLDEIGGRLDAPDEVVFTARTDTSVERWPLVVLDGFDGAGWTSSARYRPLGASLDPADGTSAAAPTARADIAPGPGAEGPWLPTQFRTVSVDGVRPAVDEQTGTLLLAGADPAPYAVTWRPAPSSVAPDAAVDRAAPGSVDVPEVPAGIVEAAHRAVPQPTGSFATASALEKWMKDNYTVATGGRLPTGSGAAQILDFLDGTKRGTSEQFATAYVLLAVTLGLPARLVVGFRAPQPGPDGSAVVRNRDAEAWPEVAVAGVGWIPLDPAGGDRRNADDTTPAGAPSSGSGAAASQGAPQQSPAPPTAGAGTAEPGGAPSLWSLVGALVLVGALWVCGVPGVKVLRRARRRRRPPREAVVGAWLDARDRLRDHGLDVGRGMTVRDVGRSTAVLEPAAVDVERLARAVDAALWSGDEPDADLVEEAWRSVSGIRRVLEARPWRDRLRALLRIRSLREPRA